jgi:hypothetical protein
MALTWAVDPQRNDLSIVKGGKLRIVYGAEEVKQRVLIALQHHWQEYFLNVPAGLPWYELMLGSKDKRLVETLVRRAVLEVPGVLSIASIKTIFPSASIRRHLEIFMVIEAVGLTGTQLWAVSLAAPEELTLLGMNEFAAVSNTFAADSWLFATA